MRRVLFTLLIAMPFICGCGGDSKENGSGDSDSTANSSAGPKYDTPEAAYKGFAAAAKKDDYGTLMSAMTPDSQSTMAFGMIMSASFMTMDEDEKARETKEKSLSELLGKHGINLEDEEEPDPNEDLENYDPQKEMLEMTKPIKDMPEFASQLAAWMKKNGEKDGGPFPDFRELGKVTVDGDSAKATFDSDMGKQPIEFRKLDGSWRVHIPDERPGGAGLEEEEEVNTDAPSLGTLSYGDKVIHLRHATAYKSKFFDDPCTVVMLTTRPLYEREMNDLTEMLKETGSDEGMYVRGPKVKLTLDEKGELQFLFAWVDNMSINRNGGVITDIQIEGDRVHGRAAMAEPDEVAGTSYDFDVVFDTQLIQP